MKQNRMYRPDKAIRVIVIFAHPDDAEFKMGGTAALMAEMGHAVKFVSLTNGDAGHHEEGGEKLAKRRSEEAQEAGRRLGIEEYVILDHHDGELLANLPIRRQVIREIRTWDADLVIGLRPNDYHPDHRYAGILVMDAAYLVVVPNIVPDTPALKHNPVFLYMEDEFKRPNPFSPDIAVSIDGSFGEKVAALDAHESQFYDWLPWVSGVLDEVPKDAKERRTWLENWWPGQTEISVACRNSLEKWYGPDKAGQIRKAESFEIAEYGHQPTDEEIRKLFPMLGR